MSISILKNRQTISIPSLAFIGLCLDDYLQLVQTVKDLFSVFRERQCIPALCTFCNCERVSLSAI